MEIKGISNAINVYSKVKMGASKTGSVEAKKKTTDKIEFNFARSVEAAKANLASEINESAPSSRLASLKESIESGSYNVSPEAVADAILSF